MARESENTANRENATNNTTTTNPKETDMAATSTHTGGTGGPGGHPNTSSPIPHAQTGGTGSTGGTGNPGGSGSNKGSNSSFEDMVKTANYETMVGASGGIGGIPESPDKIRKEYAYEDLIKVLDEEVPKILDPDILIKKIKLACVEYDDVFEKTNAVVAAKAYAAGKYLNQLQAVRIWQKFKDWGKFASKTFPKLKKTPRENRMNLASLPGVQNHFILGVERLSEFGRYFKTLNEKDKKLLGNDPIAAILGKHNVDMSLPIEENRIKIDAVLAHYNLAKKEVYIKPEVLEKFFLANHKITEDDRKHMIKIAKKDKDAPAKYLKDIIEAGGDRSDLIDDPKFDSTFVDKKIKNLDMQVTKLDKSLKKVLENGKLDGKVDLEAIDNLIKRLEQLRSTVR